MEFVELKEGDKWCLCVLRWKEAYETGYAPKIIAESTSNATIKLIKKEILLEYVFSA